MVPIVDVSVNHEIASADAEVIPMDVNPISFSPNIPGEIADLTVRIENYSGEEGILGPLNSPTCFGGNCTPRETLEGEDPLVFANPEIPESPLIEPLTIPVVDSSCSPPSVLNEGFLYSKFGNYNL